jgi:hypothetical protein
MPVVHLLKMRRDAEEGYVSGDQMDGDQMEAGP